MTNSQKCLVILSVFFILTSAAQAQPLWYNDVQAMWDESTIARSELMTMTDSSIIDQRVDSLRMRLDEYIAELRSSCITRVQELQSQAAVSVLNYLSEDPQLDGSVDYITQIQTAVDSNEYVLLEGSGDPENPSIYGMTIGLILPPGHVLLGDSTAILRRLPSSGHFITLQDSAAIVGVNIHGNKHAHYPEFDNLKKHSGNAIDMKGHNFVANCNIWENAGIAVQTWGNFQYNLVYNCTFEDCGYIDLKYGKSHYQGSFDKNSGDGIYLRAYHNVALDCMAKDAFRWGYTTSHGGGGYCTYINCDMYNTRYKTYGFIDIEGADHECLIIDCDGDHEESLWQDYRNGFWISTHGTMALFSSANFFVSGDDVKEKRGDYVTIIGCETIDSGFGVWGYSPVLVKNMANKSHNCGTLRFDARCRPDDDKTSSSFYVNALDSIGIAANNTLYEELGGPGMDILNVTDINNKMIIGDPSSVEMESTIPKKFSLFQNYPNPFNPVTNISFQLETDADITLRVFNLNGQQIATVADGVFSTGYYSVQFDGSDLPSGMYLYKLTADQSDGSLKSVSRKMLILK
ncbi:T9SS type A sorting domain-containing protein [candidate division KSB1 bacterium]|nr:T9SS type A sorting domain-containing protein [candidate division KSB1 bacterium]